MSGRDAITLFGPKLTQFGKQHLSLICAYADVQANYVQEQEGRNLLQEWSAMPPAANTAGPYFEHHRTAFSLTIIRHCHLVYPEKLRIFGLPLCETPKTLFGRRRTYPVGEGWISETKLFYEIKEAL